MPIPDTEIEPCYIIIFKGSEVAFFIKDPSYHNKLGFYNKKTEVKDLIGLYVNDKGVQVLPQHNVPYPQIFTYDITKGQSDLISVHTILSYMSCNSKVLSALASSKLHTISEGLDGANIKPNPLNSSLTLGKGLRREGGIMRQVYEATINSNGSVFKRNLG